jgi:hypothetical protein
MSYSLKVLTSDSLMQLCIISIFVEFDERSDSDEDADEHNETEENDDEDESELECCDGVRIKDLATS